MDTSIVAPNNSKVLTVKLRRETFRVSYSTDNRSISSAPVEDYTGDNVFVSKQLYVDLRGNLPTG